jgi:hypothetical protein
VFKTCSIAVREEYTQSEGLSEEGAENREKIARGCRKLGVKKRHNSFP